MTTDNAMESLKRIKCESTTALSLFNGESWCIEFGLPMPERLLILDENIGRTVNNRMFQVTYTSTIFH